MAAVFGNLTVIRRGKELFHSFTEARTKLFSNIGEDYLNNAVQYLGIEFVMSNAEETATLEKFLTSQTGPFRLISEQNILRLHGMLLNSRLAESQMPNFGYQFPFSADNLAASSFLPANFQFVSWPRFEGRFRQGKVDTCSTLTKNERERFETFDESAGGEHLAVSSGCEESPSRQQKSDISLNSEPEPLKLASENALGEGSPSKAASVSEKKGKPDSLSHEEMSPTLRSEFSEIRRFYSLELNFDREGGPLQSSTIDKMLERICRFLWFLKNVKKVEPELSRCADAQTIQEFVHYMMDTRCVKPITCSRYMTAFINVAKVPLNSHGNKEKEDFNESLERLRTIQRQLERISRKERVDDLAKKPQVEKVVYSELLELCRELKWEVNEKTGPAQARSCMNLCLLLLYCAANPGRAKEYITLRIYKNQCEEECKNQNFICFAEDESVTLFEDAYKTRPTYGPNRTDLTPLSFLTYYLQLYVTKMRPLLLNGKEHDFFFVNSRGDPFTHASYNNYISALFEKYLSLKLTTIDLRKAVVNYFLTLPQSSDLSLRESFATLMKHSVRTQKRCYDERPLAQKKCRALGLLSSVASRSLEQDAIQVLGDEDEEGRIEYLPVPGDFVSLVAANSTKNDPEVFVAKVLRLSEDQRTAYLAEFSEIEQGKFKLSAGKSYTESVNALIFPIDVVYLHSNGVYELRTPKTDIHRQVNK